MANALDPFRQIQIEQQGLRLETRYPRSGPSGHFINESLSPIHRFDFDQCPICLASDNLREEHVLPEVAGGVIATQTCHPCNSYFGSLVDVDLIDFLSSSTQSRWWSTGSNVQGFRGGGRTLLRALPGDKFALVMSGGRRLRNDFAQMMETGQITGEFQETDLQRVRISALKNAYIAACVQLQEIPQTESANWTREELLAVRHRLRRKAGLPETPLACSITMARTASDFPAPNINLCHFEGPFGEKLGILFGGRMLTVWPFPDVAPTAVESPCG